MKYHTTLSTIIISLIVLVCFALAALLCVFVMGIDSPGYMIATQALGRIEQLTGFDISYSSIERNLSQTVIINDISVGGESGPIVSIDRVTIYRNPFQLIRAFMTGTGRLSVDVTGVEVNLDMLPHDEDPSNPMSIEDVNNLLRSIESYDDVISRMSFYGLEYSINIEDFTLNLAELSFTDLRMNLILDSGLELVRFVFNAPYISLSLADASLEASNLSLSLMKDEGYIARSSLDAIGFSYGGLEATMANLAITLPFGSFHDIDLLHLPVVMSAMDSTFAYQNINASLSRISLDGDLSGADVVLLDADVDDGNLSADIPRLDLRIDYSQDGFLVAFNTAQTADLESISPGLVASIGSVSGNLSITEALTFDLAVSGIGIEGLDEITDGLYCGLTSQTVSLSGQMNSRTLFLSAAASVIGHSDIGFFDGTGVSVGASMIIEDGRLVDISMDLDALSFRQLPEIIAADITYRDGGLTGRLTYGKSLSIDMNGVGDRSISLSVSSLSLGQFRPLYMLYAPVLDSYVDANTTLSGQMEFHYDDLMNGSFDSALIGSLAISGIRFNQYRFNVASSIEAEIHDGTCDIGLFSVTTEWLRLAYSGSIDLATFFPQGNLAIEMTESGNRVLNIDFNLDSENEYYLDATVPRFPNSYLRGSINWAREGVIASEGELRSGDTIYPFDFVLDFDEAYFDLRSSGLDLLIDFRQQLDISLSFSDFTLPTISADSTVHSSLDGELAFLFDLAGQSYYGHSDGFTIHSMGFIHSRPDISFSLTISNEEVRLDDLAVNDSFVPLYGSAIYRIGDRAFAMTLGNMEERFNLSLLLNPGDYSGILTMDGARLDRYGLANTTLDTTLIGRGEGGDDFSFSGRLRMTNSTAESEGYVLTGDIILDEDGFEGGDIVYRNGTFTLFADSFTYDATEGLLSLEAGMDYVKVNDDRDYPVRASARLDVFLDPHDSFAEAAIDMASSITSSTFSARLSLDELMIDETIGIEDRVVDISFSVDEGLSFDGNLIQGHVDFDPRLLDIAILENEIVHGRISGDWSRDEFDLHLDDIHFNLSVINWLSPVPLVTFDNPSWVYGDFVLYGSPEDSHLYGYGGSHGFDMRVWWVDDAYLHIGDTQVSVVDNHATTSKTAAVIVDEDNGDLHRGFAVAQAMLSNENYLDYYDIEVWIPEGETIHVWAPVYSQNMQIKGDVNGYFRIWSDLDKNYLSGDLNLYNAMLSIGMDELPHWWGPSRFQVRDEFDVTLMENCSFVLPLSDQPIVRAYFEDGTRFHFLYDSQLREREFNGTLSFRSGEIYYFQKNFFITDGSIVFPPAGSEMSNLRMNFRARLRSYSSEGEKVDIYLVLNNATMDNFSPTFESSPQMTTEEIMSILGGSILPSSAYGGTNLASVASILTSGVDVLNRMGLINTSSYADLGSIVRDSLGIDIFSMRTSILENFLIDTIFSNSGMNFSPLATYLNNTSIYMGKYIADDLYLQAMLYLQAIDSVYNESAFMTDDLSLDLEISLEWENPLGTFTLFTTPYNLTLHSMFDNIGIRYSNTIYF